MNDIERIRDLDVDIFEEFQKYAPNVQFSKFVKKYPKTSFIINLYDTSGTFLKNSIFDNCETDDYYGAKILFRCLIEHYMRFHYIFNNWCSTKSDVFANEYYEYNNARELLDLLRAKISEQKLFDPDYKLEDWDAFLKKSPMFKNKTRKEVDFETKKYTFKRIIEYLNNQNKNCETNNSQYYGNLIVEYSNLSSFVHGGISSYHEMSAVNSEEKRQMEYKRICGLSFQMSNNIKLFSLLMYFQTDREKYSTHYLRIDEILKKINDK